MNENLPDTNVWNIEYIRKADVLNLPQSIERNLRGEIVERSVDVGLIEALPSADVAPVEYGEWIGVPEIWGSFDSRYYCSKCGNDAIINSRERYVLSAYCPHCGAIMDNKRGNENG